MQPENRVVVEVRGGVVQAVYAPTAKWLRVIVVDWDNPVEDEVAEEYATQPLDVMHPEVRAQIEGI